MGGMGRVLGFAVFVIVALSFAKAQFTPAALKSTLPLVLRFYDLQRAGKTDVKRPWGFDSGTTDPAPGGFFDAGDYGKFNFPQAFTITILSWGAFEWKKAYVEGGIANWKAVQSTIRWGTDYVFKCTEKVDQGFVIAQVGDPDFEHLYWGPGKGLLEKWVAQGQRKAFQVTCGSELGGEFAAALAAASLIFTYSDKAYSIKLLQRAVKVWNWGAACPGSYNDELGDAGKVYTSYKGRFYDELAWGAAWIARASDKGTKQRGEFVQKAVQMFGRMEGVPSNFDWNDKSVGVYMLLGIITGNRQYQAAAQSYVRKILTQGTTKSGGLTWFEYQSAWGANRHAMYGAFIAQMYADKLSTSTTEQQACQDFAWAQLKYILGANPLRVNYIVGAASGSFVAVKRPHHRNAHGYAGPDVGAGANVCIDIDPKDGTCCSRAPADNKFNISGAMVGGPTKNDLWADNRCDYQKNEVALDFNAGLAGVLARFNWQYPPLNPVPVTGPPSNGKPPASIGGSLVFKPTKDWGNGGVYSICITNEMTRPSIGFALWLDFKGAAIQTGKDKFWWVPSWVQGPVPVSTGYDVTYQLFSAGDDGVIAAYATKCANGFVMDWADANTPPLLDYTLVLF